MKLKIGFGVIILLISALSAYSQALPCVPEDGDGSCPVDTWVIVLVAAVSVFAAVRLYRRKKSAMRIIQ